MLSSIHISRIRFRPFMMTPSIRIFLISSLMRILTMLLLILRVTSYVLLRQHVTTVLRVIQHLLRAKITLYLISLRKTMFLLLLISRRTLKSSYVHMSITSTKLPKSAPSIVTLLHLQSVMLLLRFIPSQLSSIELLRRLNSAYSISTSQLRISLSSSTFRLISISIVLLMIDKKGVIKYGRKSVSVYAAC